MQSKISILFILSLLSLTACRETNPTAEITEVIESHPWDTLKASTTTANWLQPPYKYWGIKNADQLFDTGTIAKGGVARRLEKNLISFNDIRIEQYDGAIYTFDQHLDSNRTDGFLIMHKGKIICEKYYGNMTAASSHNWFSVSKSLVGLTTDILASEGLIDLEKQTTDYLPELKESAWDGATVQMVMDMLVGINYNEAYNDPSSDAYKFAKISEFVDVPGPPSEYATMMDYLSSVKRGRPHDELFHYVSLNTEVLGLIIKKVTGKQPSAIMSEKVWSKMGAEYDAYVVRNSKGFEMVSGSINSTLRDAGRFGQILINNGHYHGHQIVPESVVHKIKKGGSIEKFADSKRGQQFNNFHYKDQWWHTDNSAFFAKGLFGQWIYIDPAIDVVIVKFTTSDIPTSTETDWINNMNLMNAVVEKLSKE